jgi:citrate lyase subunit beta/citryl-CoA lyase
MNSFVGPADARSFLFVPGDRPERFEKARRSEADTFVIDWEDAVALANRDAARQHCVEILGEWTSLPLLRISDPTQSDGQADLAALQELNRPIDVMVAKAESADQLTAVASALPRGSSIVALVETARGILGAVSLAAHPDVVRLAFGHLDLAAQIGLDPDDIPALAPARFQLVAASAAAGIAPPVDGISTSVTDRRKVDADTREGRRQGFTAKLCIHPRQVLWVHAALAPTQDEIDWATRVLATSDPHGVAVSEDGFVDRPVYLRAKAILARTEEGRS